MSWKCSGCQQMVQDGTLHACCNITPPAPAMVDGHTGDPAPVEAPAADPQENANAGS